MPRHVVIVGAGVMGACTAYYLTRNSKEVEVTMIEKTDIACGASGKAGGFLAFDWNDGADTAELSRKSFELHAQLAQELGGDKFGYRPVTAYSVLIQSGKGGGKIINEVDWLLDENVRTVELLGTKKTAAQVHPGLFTRHLLEVAQKTGRVKIECGQGVRELAYRNKSVTGVILEDRREIKADSVVVCMGPWSGQLPLKGRSKRGQLPITGARAHSIILQPEYKFTAQVLFTAVVEGKKSHEPEVYPRPDGTVYLCGATDNEPLPKSAEDVPVDPAAITLLQNLAGKISSQLFSATLSTGQACYLPISRDNTPLIGLHPAYDNLFVATGHSCWGILNAPATGLMMAELLLTGKVACLGPDTVKAVDPKDRC
ncbi:FAD dependent oxidoreductase [Phycomyces nitens]|nr:FAD dependent oxidoreductase [Phycomyces nitens]